jgi:uncharacterized membrane protein (DUF2068 family)
MKDILIWSEMQKRGPLGLTLIALFKLFKGLAFLILAIGLLRLLHRDIQAAVTHWIEVFRMDPDNRYLHGMLVRIFRVTPKQLRELSAGTFVYSGIFLTEGVGLLKRKHWAEYLTVISTALFIPLECYELWERHTWPRAAILAINILTVWYLANGLRRHKF